MPSFRQITAFHRVAAVVAVLLSLVLGPAATAGGTACAILPQKDDPKPMMEDCGGSCDTMECCAISTETVPQPAVPVPAQHEILQALISQAASRRPLLAILASSGRDFPTSEIFFSGRSPDALALFCIRLI